MVLENNMIQYTNLIPSIPTNEKHTHDITL